MKQVIILSSAAALFIASACSGGNTPSDMSGNVQKTEQSAAAQPRGTIYRCDGFRPGVVSEWVQVDYDNDVNKIHGIWYWNTSDEKPLALTIIKQEFIDGEISGFTGELSFPGDKEIIGFGIIEDRFNLSYPDGRFQEFEYEYE